MKGKSVALLVLALGCGLIASLGITQVLAKRGDPSVPSDATPVYIAKTEINTGILITPEQLKLEQWPKDRVPVGAVTRQEDLDGRRARQKIYAGEPIIEPKLLARGQVPTDGLVPKGLRVVPVAVQLEAIHGGLVLPGSRCDLQVFIRADPNLGVSETLCKTILQDIRVFAVNNVTSIESQDSKTPDTRSIPGGKTVSLLVTPAQAQVVTLASQLGQIRLILRSGEDQEQTKIADMTFREMMGGAHAGGDRKLENLKAANDERFQKWADTVRKMLAEKAKAANGSAQEPQRFTMRVRSGPEVNDVLLIANSGVQGMPGDEGVWTATGLGSISHAGARNSGSATSDTHAKPVAVGPAALPTGPTATPTTRSANTLPITTSPGSPRSSDGPYTGPQPP